ncbi:MAG: TonB-dependent receptor [Vicingus serpentipes]|nr:TonB-dependent receptor [Vicingus serpentipes]
MIIYDYRGLGILKNCLMFCCLMGSLSSFAQKIKVLNQETKQPLSEVFIYNKSQSITAISDSSGFVNIAAFAKKDTLIFSHPAYKTFLIPYINVGNVVYLKENPIVLESFSVTASQVREEALEITSKIERIDATAVRLSNPPTSADMLELASGVYIQKSQMGGGSPIIRGFEANRVLLVVDGVRLNNAIYRSGHLQNAITIDNAVLERTDVIYGSNSVIYGSDAIGGVVNFVTKTPEFAAENDTVNNYEVNSYYRYASVNNERTAHLDFNLGYKKVASITSITFSYFDDLHMGKVKSSKYPEFGIVRHYPDVINGVDTMVRKSDLTLQEGTAYNQTDFLEKLKFKLSDNFFLTLNTQYSTSSDVPRYDQLSEYNGDKLKWAEWYYGPQNRLLTSLSAQMIKENKWFTEAEIIVSYQKIDEDRITRRFESNDRITREEDVNVYAINADFHKKNSNLSEWFYGVETIYNDVQSNAFNENILTLTKSSASTRYPDGGSSLSSAGVYLSYKHQFSEKATYSLGTRYSYSILDAAFFDTTFIQLPFSDIRLNNGALIGNAGLVYHPNDKWRIHIGLSSSYRSPNVDDVGKVFAKDDYVMIPNDQLKSEMAYNAELGITRSYFDNKLKLNVIGYYTILKNAVTRDFFQLNGVDSLMYEGELLQIQANVNSDEALVYGVSANLLLQVTKELTLKSAINYTVGENTVSEAPLAHIPPLYGRTDLIINSAPLILTLYTKYQGWKKIADYSLFGEDNENKATIDGTPPWWTANISAAMKIKKSFMVQAAFENMLDVHYRPFASGVSAPGRNLVVTLRASF